LFGIHVDFKVMQCSDFKLTSAAATAPASWRIAAALHRNISLIVSGGSDATRDHLTDQLRVFWHASACRNNSSLALFP
jgi:hypothetical protein